MKRSMNMLAVAGIVAALAAGMTAVAGEGGGKHGGKVAGAPHEKPALTDMTFAGVISKETRTMKDGASVDTFVLTDAAGNKIGLGGRHGKKGEDQETVKLADYVGKNVTVIGKGFTKTVDGKTTTRLVVVSKVEAAAAPAAPAAQ